MMLIFPPAAVSALRGVPDNTTKTLLSAGTPAWLSLPSPKLRGRPDSARSRSSLCEGVFHQPGWEQGVPARAAAVRQAVVMLVARQRFNIYLRA